MSKAGPLTISVSKRVRATELPAGSDDHAKAVQAPSNAQSSQLRGEFGPNLHSDEIVIGLALGSPRQNSLPFLPPDDHDIDVAHVCSSPNNPASTLGSVGEIGSGGKSIKRKGSKWKSLGSLFGRRGTRSASPFYQPDQILQPEPANQFITENSLETNSLRRKRADSNHGNKVHKIDLSSGMAGEGTSGLLRTNSSRRKGLRRRKTEEPQPEMQRIPAKYTAHAIAENLGPHGEQQRSPMPGTSLLQVEIPCVELERYSVMFGDVLKPQARQSKPQPSPLSRRQAHLDELHPVAALNSEPFDHDLPEAHIRAGSMSSQSSKFPSFSLFPPTPLSARSPVNKLLLKPIPLSRSVTAPSHHPILPRPAVQRSNSQDQEHVRVMVHKSEDIPRSPTSHGCESTFGPSQRSANPTASSFFESAEHPGYSCPAIASDRSTPMSGATQDCLKHAFPARKSSMKRLDSPDLRSTHQGEDMSGPAAEVSVARQISISRRQRQLLVPIVPKTARQPMQPRVNEQNTTEELRKTYHLNLEDA